MALCIREGAAIVALFSAFSASADWFEDLSRTPKTQIHQPPTWLDHLAKSPRYVEMPDGFSYQPPPVAASIGRYVKPVEKKGCLLDIGDGKQKWGFCDL